MRLIPGVCFHLSLVQETYPPVIKHGLLENILFISIYICYVSIFSIETPQFRVNFQLPRLNHWRIVQHIGIRSVVLCRWSSPLRKKNKRVSRGWQQRHHCEANLRTPMKHDKYNFCGYLMGFVGDWMGCHGHSMGFDGDVMRFYGDPMGFTSIYPLVNSPFSSVEHL